MKGFLWILAANAIVLAPAEGQLRPRQILGPPIVTTLHMTNFKPSIYGFKFVNSFTNDFVPQLDWRTQGLCGGMTYAALDYYFTGVNIPTQQFKPAVGTVLQKYLYDRQVTSIVSNADHWAELGFNPGGARNGEFFNWGLSAKPGGRLAELKSFIDNGIPCPLGLQGDGQTGSHQVIAIGYDMGRYRGDLGANKQDLQILICDPNHPGLVRTLVPDLAHQVYTFKEPLDDGEHATWRTYFVNTKYVKQRPPVIPNANYPNNGLAYELVLDFFTGGDDLRGGNDNINVIVTLMNGTQQPYSAVNLGKRWVVNDDEPAELILRQPVAPNQIKSLTIVDTFGGGIGGDNWDMKAVAIYALGGGGMFNRLKVAGPYRFTGDQKFYVVKVNDVPTVAGQANWLSLKFHTGGDDLRGGNDNLNVTVRFRDGRSQTFNNVNGGLRWADNTDSEVSLDLDHAVMPADIVEVRLQTTFSGGMGGDNWNMDSVVVSARGPGVDRPILSHGYKRFTGDDKTLSMAH